MGKTFLVIADDFTGANDTGVHLRSKGVPTYVTFQSKCEEPHVSERVGRGSVRFSLGFHTTKDEIDAVIVSLQKILKG